MLTTRPPRLGTWVFCLLCMILATACSDEGKKVKTTRFAATSSLRDSGLMVVLKREFEAQYDTKVEFLIVGTGAALTMAENGDVEGVVVHARKKELAFMAKGNGQSHDEIFSSDFIILGPPKDPSQIRGLSAADAMAKIAADRALFVSRGDNSGTHAREKSLWPREVGEPNWDNYLSTGRGMGASLTIADEKLAYILCDRPTFLNYGGKIDLEVLVENDPVLFNPYSIIILKPDPNSPEKSKLAQDFRDFVCSKKGQQLIADFEIEGAKVFRAKHQANPKVR